MPKKEKKEKKISAKNIAAESNNKKVDETLKCAIQNETKHLFYIKMTDAFFEALAHQQLPMQKAINEPVDNAIANCDDETATILAAIDNANLANQFRFTIADWGNGMDENELVKGMQICGGHDKEGYLCVHGLGLKNFLLVATRNKYDWMVASKKPGEKIYHVVEGPFSTTMEMKESKEVPLKEIVMTDTLKRYGEPSTIVSVVVDADVASTMLAISGSCNANRVRNIHMLHRALAEHLGVSYRRFLQPDKNGVVRAQIIIPNMKTAENKIRDVRVRPLGPCYTRRTEEKFDVPYAGYNIPVSVEYGILDKDAMSTAVAGGYPPKYHYLGNPLTQGMDICIGGRTIATAQLESIFTKGHGEGDKDDVIARHPSFNYFTGSINITDVEKLPRGFLKTLANKSNVDMSDGCWAAIFRAVDEKVTPIRLDKSLAYNKYIDMLVEEIKKKYSNEEDVYVKKLHQVYANRAIVDILEVTRNKTCEVYIIKRGNATMEDIARIRTAWDGVVAQGDYQPTVGHIICRKTGNMTPHTLAEFNGMVQSMSDAKLAKCFDESNGIIRNMPHYNFVIEADPRMPD